MKAVCVEMSVRSLLYLGIITHVVEARSNSVGLILKEIASHSAVADISRPTGRVEVLCLSCARKQRCRSGEGKDVRRHLVSINWKNAKTLLDKKRI